MRNRDVELSGLGPQKKIIFTHRKDTQPKCPQICDFTAQELALSNAGKQAASMSPEPSLLPCMGGYQAAVLQLSGGQCIQLVLTDCTAHMGETLRWGGQSFEVEAFT